MRKKLFTKTFLFVLLFCSLRVTGQQGLFISELADPGDDYTGRFVELFNSGSETIDFSTQTFYLSRQSNGGTTYGDVMLTGSVAPGETYVIGTSNFSGHYGFTPDLETGILIGNGDDAYFLFAGGDHVSGTIHDIYGVRDVDGTGEPWEYTDSRAVRNADVSVPSSSWVAGEWTINPADIIDCDPGIHHGNGGGDIPQPGNFSLSAVNDTVDVGQLAEVHLTVSPLLTEDNIISYQFDLEYPVASLEYSDFIIVGTMSEAGTIEVNASTPGMLSVSFMHSEAITGEGDLLILRFNTLTTDTSAITLSNTYFNNTPVESTQNGIVIASENTPPSGYITYNDTVNRLADTLQITAIFSEPMEISVPVTISMQGSYVQSEIEMLRMNDTVYMLEFQVPNSGGVVNISFSGGVDLHSNLLTALPDSGSSFSIIPLSPGDVDDDGKILAYDAALALQYSVGLDPLPEIDGLPWEPWRDSTANVDGAGNITAYDAALILQYSAGIITDFETTTKKSAQKNAGITTKVINDALIFYSEGDLIGLNVIVEEGSTFLGRPEILHSDYMEAFNITDDYYHIGLCTARSLPDHTPILKIPFTQNAPIKFVSLENTSEKTHTVDLGTGLNKLTNNQFRIFPNPVQNIVHIELTGKDYNERFKLKLMNLAGQQLYESTFTGNQESIDVSGFDGQGICILCISGEEDDFLINYKIVL